MHPIDYRQMKQSKNNNLPTFDSCFYSVLNVLIEQNNVQPKENIQKAVLDNIQHLPANLLTLRYEQNHELIIIDRINWALTYLKKAGLIDSPRRKYYQITKQGIELFKQIDFKFDINDLKQFKPDIVKSAHAKVKTKAPQVNTNDKAITMHDLKQYAQLWQLHLQKSLLNQLIATDPYIFENMMVALLSKMGYKGTHGLALTTQKSNDGGIDGIINQDPLGLQSIYLQVKRYDQANHVDSPKIDAFAGALRRFHANLGVFITTSSFTKGATLAANQLNIRLIDGETLVKLMLQYKVGIKLAKSFDFYDIDQDFFNNN